MSTQTAATATPTAARGELAGQVIGLACLWLPVQELEPSLRWYTEVLGLELLQEHPAGGQALLRLSPEGPGLFLKQVAAPPALHFDHEGNRTSLFEWRVDDLEARRRRLVAHGLPSVGEIERSDCGEKLN